RTITQPDDRAIFVKIAPARAAFAEAYRETMQLTRSGDPDGALLVFRSKVRPAYDALETIVKEMAQWNIYAGAEAGAEVDRAVSTTLAGVMIGVAVTIFLGVGVALVIVRGTNGVLRGAVTELRVGAEQVASASNQVSTAAQSLSQGATEQAASLEETSASMEEMASMTRQNAENSQQAAGLMASVDQKVRESNGSLEAMVSSMAAIKESSNSISRIIKTIDEIAFQTNILALNAAVEAARAGEAGMGFAVVADEVRSLAQRSAQAAKDTAGLIETSIARSTEGAHRVEEVATSIRGITDAVVEVKGLVDSVSAASQQQSQGIDQVSQAIAQMEKVTQTNAATAEESAAASEELSAQAATSMSVVARLDALVGGAADTPAAAPSAVRTARAAAPARVLPLKRRQEVAIPLEDDQPSATGTFGSF
ncbi:MAG: methyl-accepting chemotaxis protein, partial [Vicinamibacteria bacterium]